MQRHLLVVLGMHRSGTSALTGALAKLGALAGHATDAVDRGQSRKATGNARRSCALTTSSETLGRALGQRLRHRPAGLAGAIRPSRRCAAEAGGHCPHAEFGRRQIRRARRIRDCAGCCRSGATAFSAAGFTVSCASDGAPADGGRRLARPPRPVRAGEIARAVVLGTSSTPSAIRAGLPRATICYDALLADAGGELSPRVRRTPIIRSRRRAAQKKAAIELGPARSASASITRHRSARRAKPCASGLDYGARRAVTRRLAELAVAARIRRPAVTALAQLRRAPRWRPRCPRGSHRSSTPRRPPPGTCSEVETTRRAEACVCSRPTIEAARSAHKACATRSRPRCVPAPTSWR